MAVFASLLCLALAAVATTPTMPDDVAALAEKAQRIDRNAQGLWEAELDGGIVLVYIPAGRFTMGSNRGERDERPVHEVDLDAYWLGKFPVTVGQFRAFVEAAGYRTDAERGAGAWQYYEGDWRPRRDGNWKNPYFAQDDSHPVVSVSWNDALAYCRWLAECTGLPFSLPTEAQWEKGARGTDERTYPWGNGLPDGRRANFADLNFWRKYGRSRPVDKRIDDGWTETSPVGHYPAGASPYGLLDMAGNVWEWCWDRYDPGYYAVSPARNPTGPQTGAERVNRGGSWTDRAGRRPRGGHNLRAAERTGDDPGSSDDHMGFRVCLSPH